MYKFIYIILTFLLISCTASVKQDVKSPLIGKWKEILPKAPRFAFLHHFYTFTNDSFFIRTNYTDDTMFHIQIDSGKGIYTVSKNSIILIGEFYSSCSIRGLYVYNDSLKRKIVVPDTIKHPLTSGNFINEKYKYHFSTDTLIFTDSAKGEEYHLLRE